MKRLALALLLLACAPSFAQVAFVSDSTSNPATVDDNATLASVPGSTGNFLLCGLSYETLSLGASTTAASWVYGAASMTEVLDTCGGGTVCVAIAYLVNPAGTDTVSVDLSANSNRRALNCAIFSGVNTSSPIGDSDSLGSNDVGGTPATILTLTTTADSYLYDILTKQGNTDEPAEDGSQTEISTFASGSGPIYHKASVKDGAGGGTMEWDFTGPADVAQAAVSISPAGGASAVVPIILQQH